MLYDNIGLLLPRQLSKLSFQHVFCTNKIPEMCCISTATKEQNQLSPLYLYYEDIVNGERKITKEINFTTEFMEYLTNLYKEEFSPEQILGYLYAVLHSQTYREKYFEDLKIEFAKIPFTKSKEEFVELSQIGSSLINAHLLIEFPEENIGAFIGEGNNWIEKVEYDEKTGKIFINNEQYFSDVSTEIYNFKIGGFHPIDKYLKSRKEQTLSLEQINTVESIIKVIHFTIEKMDEIEEKVNTWI